MASPDGVSPDSDEVKAASEFPVPQTTPHLRSFVCPNSYFHRFIRGFATISALLTSLLIKDTPFKLTQDCANDFAKLKQVLTSSPTLRHYDPDTTAELYLQTPAETALEQFSISEVKMNRCNTLLPIQTELSQKKKETTRRLRKNVGNRLRCGKAPSISLWKIVHRCAGTPRLVLADVFERSIGPSGRLGVALAGIRYHSAPQV